MSAETEARAAGGAIAPEVDAEQEVDFARYWRMLAARWWLAVAGLVVGVVAGVLVSLGNTGTYTATTLVYIGNPLAPGAGGPVSSVPTLLGLAAQALGSEATIRQVAAKVGLRPADLRDQIQVQPEFGLSTGKTPPLAPIVSVTVLGSAPRKIEAAADMLGQIAIDRSSGYVNVKIAQLEQHLVYDARQLEITRERLSTAQKEQQVALNDKSLGAAERLISLENFNSIVSSSISRQATLEQDQFAVRQVLQLARDVEHGRIVAKAAALKTTARSRRTSALVGGLIGLVIGLVAAIAWEPLARLLGRRPAPS